MAGRAAMATLGAWTTACSLSTVAEPIGEAAEAGDGDASASASASTTVDPSSDSGALDDTGPAGCTWDYCQPGDVCCRPETACAPWMLSGTTLVSVCLPTCSSEGEACQVTGIGLDCCAGQGLFCQLIPTDLAGTCVRQP